MLPSGTKTFLYIYLFQGKKKNLYLGQYPYVSLAEARLKYNDAYNKVQMGEDPAQAPVPPKAEEPATATFGDFADLYIKWSETNHAKAWYKTVKMSLQNDVLPYWKNRPIADIKRRDAIALLERVAARAPGQAKNVHKVARAVFEYAISREHLEANPMLKLSKVVPTLKPVVKKRILSDSEIKHVWKSLDEGTGDERTKAAIKLILVTAQRPVEVATMHRSQIEGNWLTMQDTKNSETHRVYLTATALELIGDNDGYIFPSYKPGPSGEARPIVRQTLSQHVASQKYFGLTTWTPHDLRRTARTVMARLGIPEEHAEAVLNHKKQGVVKVYNLHQYANEKKTAMLLWEKELKRILAEE